MYKDTNSRNEEAQMKDTFNYLFREKLMTVTRKAVCKKS